MNKFYKETFKLKYSRLELINYESIMSEIRSTPMGLRLLVIAIPKVGP